MARRRSKDRISLPWERRQTLLSGVFRNPRWRAILATLIAGAAAWSFFRYARHELRVRNTEVAIHQVERAIERFRTDMGRCPSSNEELLRPPRAQTHYLDQMPNDGWGRPLHVRCPGYYEDEADVTSAGPSGSLLKDDNIP